jgi:predicted metal-dependent peptidase
MSVTEIDLITQFRALFFDYFPYIAHYSYSLTPVPRPGLGTMAVDRKGHMYFDPEWSETLTLEEGGYVCCHEAWHLILRHCHRARQIIGDNPTEQQRMDLNTAADIIVWLMMEEVAHMAPKGGVTYPDAKKKWPSIDRNMTLGELYQIIHNEKEVKEDGKSPDKNPGEDTGDGDGNPGEKVDDHGFKDVVKGSAADNQQREWETEENDAWDAYIEDSLLETVEKAIEELETTDDKWSPSRGRIPGRLKRIIKQKLHPTVNPWNQLKDIIARSLSQNKGKPEHTFMVRNRRQSCMQPGVVLAGERRYQPSAAVIMDTSGSMTSMCLAKAAAICCQGTKAVGGFRLVCWDWVLQLDMKVQSPVIDWPAPGGGGTCMKSAIEYVLSNTKEFGKPDVIICVTDGGTGWPDEMPNGTKLVIALTQDSGTPDWAKTIRIPDPGKIQEEPIE